MDPLVCDPCILGLAACWSRAEALELVCAAVGRERAALARGEVPDTDYRGLVRRRSDPSHVPPPLPVPAPAPPAAEPIPYFLPACPDRGPMIDASDCPACQTSLCRKFVRVVSGAECTRCEKAGFTYSG
jgi:hypothetical protein